ncbi:hypothetical protein niasHT_036537 [Heterodera trifolii]|uniref:Uncharacterized protein n=1 Tax=Heterodera trifolii TaxID=157864 RepID=A0ABD2ISX4_9BILA
MHPNDQHRRDQNAERRRMKKELAEIVQHNIELNVQILKRKKETAQIEERRKRIESDLAFQLYEEEKVISRMKTEELLLSDEAKFHAERKAEELSKDARAKDFQIEHQAKQLKEERSEKEEAQVGAIKQQQLKEEALIREQKAIEDKQFYRKRALQYLGEVEETETKKSVLQKALAFMLGGGNAKRKKANADGSGPSSSISCPIELSAHSAVFEKHALPKEETIVEEVGLEDEQKNAVGKMVAHEMSLADELKMAHKSADNNDETITGTSKASVAPNLALAHELPMADKSAENDATITGKSKALVAPNLALENELQMVDKNVVKKGNMTCSSLSSSARKLRLGEELKSANDGNFRKSSASQNFLLAPSGEESKRDDGDTDQIGSVHSNVAAQTVQIGTELKPHVSSESHHRQYQSVHFDAITNRVNMDSASSPFCASQFAFARALSRPLLLVGLSIVALLLLTFLIIIVSIRFNLI